MEGPQSTKKSKVLGKNKLVQHNPTKSTLLKKPPTVQKAQPFLPLKIEPIVEKKVPKLRDFLSFNAKWGNEDGEEVETLHLPTSRKGEIIFLDKEYGLLRSPDENTTYTFEDVRNLKTGQKVNFIAKIGSKKCAIIK